MCELSFSTNNTTYFASICFMSIRIHACLDMNFPLIQVVIDPASTRSFSSVVVGSWTRDQAGLAAHAQFTRGSPTRSLVVTQRLTGLEPPDSAASMYVCMQYGHDHHCTRHTLLSGREVLFKSILTLFLTRTINNHFLMILIFC